MGPYHRELDPNVYVPVKVIRDGVHEADTMACGWATISSLVNRAAQTCETEEGMYDCFQAVEMTISLKKVGVRANEQLGLEDLAFLNMKCVLKKMKRGRFARSFRKSRKSRKQQGI